MKEKIKKLDDLLDRLSDNKKKKAGLFVYMLVAPLGFELAALYGARYLIRTFTEGDGNFKRYMDLVRKDGDFARDFYRYRSRF